MRNKKTIPANIVHNSKLFIVKQLISPLLWYSLNLDFEMVDKDFKRFYMYIKQVSSE